MRGADIKILYFSVSSDHHHCLFMLRSAHLVHGQAALQAGNANSIGPGSHCQQLVGRRRVDSRVRPSAMIDDVQQAD